MKYFNIQEFVPPSIYNNFGESSTWFIDNRITEAADEIREFFDRPMIINKYRIGLENRGFRKPDVGFGASLSQHKFGRAIDFHIVGKDTKEVYNTLVENEDKLLDWGITTLENIEFTYDEDTNKKGWIHADCRTTNQDSLLIVDP